MKISRDVLIIILWVLIGMILLTKVSPGDVELPYAEY